MRLLTAAGHSVCLLASLCHHIIPIGATPTAAASAAPEPEIAIAKAPTPAAAFATTKTRVWSTTTSSVSVVLWINSRRITSYTKATMTAYEPGPVTGPFPATVTQTVVSHITWEDHTTYLEGAGAGAGAATTSRTSLVETTGQVWIVSPAQATDLAVPAGARPGCEATAVCAEVKPDAVCEASGLETACLGQCERRDDGNYWCYRMWQREYGKPGMTMGRACWGGNLRFEQLNVPCVEGDVDVACVRCKGIDQTWGAVNWSGPG